MNERCGSARLVVDRLLDQALAERLDDAADHLPVGRAAD